MTRLIIRMLFVPLIIQIVAGSTVSSAGTSTIPHPLKGEQKYTEHARCDNCGMDRNSWARTRHDFRTGKGTFHTCSLHCLAVLCMKLKARPQDVRVAHYLDPQKMIEAERSVYVVGSAVPGTMTKRSKAALSTTEEAQRFIEGHGGTAMTFEEALRHAEKEIGDYMR